MAVCSLVQVSKHEPQDWQENNELEQDLEEFAAQNLKQTKFLDFVLQKFPQLDWSIAILYKCLCYFGIHYINYASIVIKHCKCICHINIYIPPSIAKINILDQSESSGSGTTIVALWRARLTSLSLQLKKTEAGQEKRARLQQHKTKGHFGFVKCANCQKANFGQILWSLSQDIWNLTTICWYRVFHDGTHKNVYISNFRHINW